MRKVIFLQFVLALFATALGALMFGFVGAVSAALGGLVCLLPNALFAWRLSLAQSVVTASQAGYRVAMFFVGEAIKVASVIGLLVAVWLLYPEAHWGAVVLGMMLTLQANFLALKLRL